MPPRSHRAAQLILGTVALVLGSCRLPDRKPNRQHAIYLGAGMAGLNNPNGATGDEDNLSVAVGARLTAGDLSLRPEAHGGDHSFQFTPSLTYDFPLAGEGPGSLDGNLGVGVSFLDTRENNVLGNTTSPFARIGVEGYLVRGILAGAALMVAPWGYDDEDTAIAGITYVGLRF